MYIPKIGVIDFGYQGDLVLVLPCTLFYLFWQSFNSVWIQLKGF